MNKEVIYIDVEDDITDIIGKVKSAKEKIIALVPPKGIGVLRSAVNLRLLLRNADQNDKRIVLITNDTALRSIAAGAKVPVTKTLQSKPEIPEIDTLEVDGEDIIDGEKMPVGDFAKNKKDNSEDEILNSLDIDDNKSFSKKEPNKTKKKGGKGKIPDFNKFRKKLFIFGGAGLVLIVFLVWAIIFAPAATIIINAKTSVSNVQELVDLTDTEKLAKPEEGILLAKTESISKPSEVSFDATGTKDIGEKATGTMTLSQSIETDGLTVPSGTGFSSGDCTFVTQKNLVIPGAKIKNGVVVPGSADISVSATEVGEQCNLSSRTYLSTLKSITASGSSMSGGSKKTIKIVTEADVQNAKQSLVDNKQSDAKSELVSKFGNSVKLIDESYNVDYKDPTVAPAVGQEAPNGKATIKSQTVYSMVAVEKSQISKFLDKQLTSKMDDKNNQKIFKNGLDDVKFSGYKAGSGVTNAKITTNGRIGPKIEEDKIKEESKGKRFGEVQSKIESIEGVNNVDIKFSFFWVSSVPNDTNKITVKFDVEN